MIGIVKKKEIYSLSFLANCWCFSYFSFLHGCGVFAHSIFANAAIQILFVYIFFFVYFYMPVSEKTFTLRVSTESWSSLWCYLRHKAGFYCSQFWIDGFTFTPKPWQVSESFLPSSFVDQPPWRFWYKLEYKITQLYSILRIGSKAQAKEIG